MEILSTMPNGNKGKWVLVKLKENFYAYGVEQDMHSYLGFPVDQCGTKEQVLRNIKSILGLCKKNIEEFNKKISKTEKSEQWKFLLEMEQYQLEMLTEFARILENINKPVFEIDYSLEGTDIKYDIDATGHLVVKTEGMTIRSAEKVTKETNLNALALAMRSEAIETMKKKGVFLSMEEILEYAAEKIMSLGGCKADVEQISDEIKECGYNTTKEVDEHIKNYYEQEETIEKRKVLFKNGMSNDFMLIITDAPKEAIENYCRYHNIMMEEGGHFEVFGPLKSIYYVKELLDSEVDDSDDVDIIGYDELYDLSDYVKQLFPVIEGYRTIKLTAGMTQEFEIISTNAPDSVIKAQLTYTSECQESGEQIENPYAIIEAMGYVANTLGCQDDFDADDLKQACIDAEFDYYNF